MFFEVYMEDAQMDTNDKNRSVLDMEVEPFTTTEPKCWKLADHRLDSTLVTKPA